MKRIICLILALLMLVSVVGCADVSNPSNDSDAPATDTPTGDTPTGDTPTSDTPTSDTPTSDTPTSEKIDAPVYNEVFKTGYARVAITPSVPIGEYTKVHDDIYGTCLAINDGETTVLFVSIDMGSMMEDKCDGLRNKIKSVTKIPADNIFIAVTHSHSSVGFGTDAKWTFDAYTKIANACKEAIADLSDTEMFIGTLFLIAPK